MARDNGEEEKESFWFLDMTTGQSGEIEGDPFVWMRRQEEAANAAHPDAHGIAAQHDQHWVRLDNPVPIFGLAWTLAHQLEAEQKYYDMNDADQVEEFVDHGDVLTESFRRGYRFGRAWSVWCPEGELGSTHCSVMVPITPEMFEYAEAMYWEGERLHHHVAWRQLFHRVARHD